MAATQKNVTVVAPGSEKATSPKGKAGSQNKAQAAPQYSSKISEKRLQKLLFLKHREDMKDAIVNQLKEKYYAKHGSKKTAKTEGILDSAVENFVETKAKLSSENLDRLLKKVEIETGEKKADERSAVSAYSQMSGTSVQSHVERMTQAREQKEAEGQDTESGPAKTQDEELAELMNFQWSRIDKYVELQAAEEAEVRARKKEDDREALKAYLDDQCKVKADTKSIELASESIWSEIILKELAKQKEDDEEKEAAKKSLAKREKEARDEQAAEVEKRLAEDAAMLRKQDIDMLARIQREIEAAQKKEQEEKIKKRKQMDKVKAELEATRQRKIEEAQLAQEEEMARAKAYAKLLEEQEKQRQQELADRVERQKQLMERMQKTVMAQAASKGREDEIRANAQRDEAEAKAQEAQEMKEAKLKALRMETQEYLLAQMALKAEKKLVHMEVKQAQGDILLQDSKSFATQMTEKVKKDKIRSVEFAAELRDQIREHAARKITNMTLQEAKLNKSLIGKVNAKLADHEAKSAATSPMKSDAA